MSKRMSGPELNNLSDEKRKVVNKSLGQHPSGVEAPVDSADVSARLKSSPTQSRIFSPSRLSPRCR